MVASDGRRVFDVEATAPLETVVAKGYWNLAFLRAEEAAVLSTPPSKNARQRRTLEFILKGSGESYLCIAFVGF